MYIVQLFSVFRKLIRYSLYFNIECLASLFIELRVCCTDTDWFRFTPLLSLTTPSFQDTEVSWMQFLALERIMISRVNAEAIEWRCWTRIIRHLSYFSTSYVETEAVRIKRRGLKLSDTK